MMRSLEYYHGRIAKVGEAQGAVVTIVLHQVTSFQGLGPALSCKLKLIGKEIDVSEI